MDEWLVYLQVLRGTYIQKGGPGSGHRGHKGRKGKRGGSAPSEGARSRKEIIREALTFVNKLITTGGPASGQQELSTEAREFLAQTVTKESYNLKRGIGLIKDRVDPKDVPELRRLKPGDPAPTFLAKQHTPYASYSKKVSVAKDYAQGKMGVVISAKVSASKVIVDLEALPKVLSGVEQDIFDSYDFDYFRADKEVIVLEPVSGVVHSITGRL